MSKPIFYSDATVVDNGFQLDETESKHAVRVLRLKEDDEVWVVNGKGIRYTCKITVAHAKRCHLEIVATEESAAPGFILHMAVAPTKNNDRYNWFLEKATEIGVQRISPILCEHSERKVIKQERLEKVVIGAMKQSQSSFLPQLDELQSFSNFVTCDFEGQKFIAHCEDSDKTSLKNALQKEIDTLILIGPEGDFSPAEIELALQAGFKPISLGNTRLRTETAAIVACHTVNLMNA